MARKVRKQLVIDEALELELAELARRSGVSQSEHIRRALDAYLHDPASARRATAKAKLMEMLRARAARTTGAEQHPRSWTREDAYEERIERYRG